MTGIRYEGKSAKKLLEISTREKKCTSYSVAGCVDTDVGKVLNMQVYAMHKLGVRIVQDV